jgi:hypothetical protein
VKRQINAKEIVDDLRSGNTDSELMEKYELSPKALQAICRKLVARQAISQSELYERSPLDPHSGSEPIKSAHESVPERAYPFIYQYMTFRIRQPVC